MTPAVEYVVDLREPHRHLIRVTARFPSDSAELDLRMPVWTPGSYLVREYARNLQDVVAETREGRALVVTKVDKSTWRVQTGGAKQITVRYAVYANDLTVRSSHLDSTHGYFNGACLFLYSAATTDKASLVVVQAPDGWRITTALAPLEGTLDKFVAKNYDELVDSPFEVGTHEVVEFRAADRPHRIAIWGDCTRPRVDLVADFTKIIDASAAIFDGVPYDDYTFIILLAPGAYGGLEHKNSTTLLSSPFTFGPRRKYEDFLELASHEYFHLWNVKRIHPEVLGPFDYTKEAYTRVLWMMEGITSYYDRHLLVRAGLLPQRRFLSKFADDWAKLQTSPGRLHHSLEEASFDAWIKHYRPDENTVNTSISYYLKGGLVATLIDLEIRRRTDGKRSLDDVMRTLWHEYGQKGRGFPEAGVQELFERVAGVPMGDLFDKWIRGRDEVDPTAAFAYVGLQLVDAHEEDEANQAYLGINWRDDNGPRVREILEGSPAERAGLSVGDELVALNGYRIASESTLRERVLQRRPRDTIEMVVFRRDRLLTLQVELGERPTLKYELLPVDNATAAQTAAYMAWLGGSFPEA